MCEGVRKDDGWIKWRGKEKKRDDSDVFYSSPPTNLALPTLVDHSLCEVFTL